MPQVPREVVDRVKKRIEMTVQNWVEGYLSCLDENLECMGFEDIENLDPDEVNYDQLDADFQNYLKENEFR